MRKQTLRLKNLTKEVIYCYGTSGEMVCLKPEPVADNQLVTTMTPEKDTYYIADDGIYKTMANTSKFRNVVLFPKYIGQSRDGKNLYHFKDVFQNDIRLVTDGVMMDDSLRGEFGHKHIHYSFS